jgi:hypothetical protein
MTLHPRHGIACLLLFFSLSGCSTLAKHQTTSVSAENGAAALFAPVVPAAPEAREEATVTAIIQVDPVLIAEMDTPVLSEKMKNKHKKKKVKRKIHAK